MLTKLRLSEKTLYGFACKTQASEPLVKFYRWVLSKTLSPGMKALFDTNPGTAIGFPEGFTGDVTKVAVSEHIYKVLDELVRQWLVKAHKKEGKSLENYASMYMFQYAPAIDSSLANNEIRVDNWIKRVDNG